MDKYIDLETAIFFICDEACKMQEPCGIACAEIRAIRQVPTTDVVDREQYDKVLTAAKAMHRWIFLNTADEFEVYNECGLTDEMNALLGSVGSYEIRKQENEQ